jgi:hypothetical protein
MSDIVERLRREASREDILACETMLQGADEIERLRTEIEELKTRLGFWERKP